MDDARRFLRYLIPGSVFFIETALLLFGMLPDWTIDRLNTILTRSEANQGLGLAVAFLIGSGTLGFLLSMFHHTLYWRFPLKYPAVDYRDFVNGLRHDMLISEELNSNGEDRMIAMDAWIIVTKLWHERVKENGKIEGANWRADSNADLVHSIGACQIALLAATLTSLSIVLDRLWVWHLRVDVSRHVLTADSAIVAAVSLLVCCRITYGQTLH